MVRTRVASSNGVSPLARSATAKAAICASVALPSRIVAIASAIRSASRSLRRTSGCRTSGQCTRLPGLVTVLIPPQVVVEHTAGDEAHLHLTRAFDDRQLLRVAVVQLHRMVLHVPRSTE